jgi:hypothetical protein
MEGGGLATGLEKVLYTERVVPGGNAVWEKFQLLTLLTVLTPIGGRYRTCMGVKKVSEVSANGFYSY